MINHVIPFEAKHLDIDVVKENIKYLYEEDIKNWYLKLIDLKSILPQFFNWIEEQFKDKITVTRNMMFDVIKPIAGVVQPPETSISTTLRTTSGRTLEASETEFSLKLVFIFLVIGPSCK